MPKQKPQLVNDEIYHIVLRSVGDTTIFVDENDNYRGIFSIYEFNNTKSVEIWLRRLQRKKEKMVEKLLGGQTSQYIDKRDRLVKILAFSFMPNHIHLLVRQLKDNGISKFMRKVGTGYAAYFNKKYKRKGHLFNTFHAVLIETDDQLKNVVAYIHTNRISMIEPGWKECGIKNPERVIDFLESDKWHSYPDYLGKNNFNSITDREFILELMGGIDGCRDNVNNWIKYKQKLYASTYVFLE